MSKTNENIKNSSLTANSMFSSLAPAKADRGLGLNASGFLGQRVAAAQVVAVKPDLQITHEMMDLVASTVEKLQTQLEKHPIKSGMSSLAYLVDMAQSLASGAAAINDLSQIPAQRSYCSPAA